VSTFQQAIDDCCTDAFRARYGYAVASHITFRKLATASEAADLIRIASACTKAQLAIEQRIEEAASGDWLRRDLTAASLVWVLAHTAPDRARGVLQRNYGLLVTPGSLCSVLYRQLVQPSEKSLG
jgi:hypothetical protein